MTFPELLLVLTNKSSKFIDVFICEFLLLERVAGESIF